jgi:hypothetical protein
MYYSAHFYQSTTDTILWGHKKINGLNTV